MEKTVRTIELTVETRETYVAQRRRRKSVPVWCDGCGCVRPMLAPEAAAQAAGLKMREVYRRIEAGQVHFVESVTGELLVCMASLQSNR